MPRYQVARDERTISRHSDLEEAKAALKRLPLGKFSMGFLDEIDEQGEPTLTLFDKQGTKGELREVN